jgi:hypothetical protein
VFFEIVDSNSRAWAFKVSHVVSSLLLSAARVRDQLFAARSSNFAALHKPGMSWQAGGASSSPSPSA